MRELLYAVEGKAANLSTFVMDEPGPGGACHKYHIRDHQYLPREERVEVDIHFQNGPIDSIGNGVNGVQHEDLLAILIDRLEGFQKGPFACEENLQSLIHCRAALKEMNDRTRKRIARGVEGTHTV